MTSQDTSNTPITLNISNDDVSLDGESTLTQIANAINEQVLEPVVWVRKKQVSIDLSLEDLLNIIVSGQPVTHIFELDTEYIDDHIRIEFPFMLSIQAKEGLSSQVRQMIEQLLLKNSDLNDNLKKATLDSD